MLIDLKCSNISKLISMMAYLESMGDIGHCTDIHIRFDGDGCSNLKLFFPENDEMNECYDKLKKSWIDLYDKEISKEPKETKKVECSFIFE